MIQTDLFESESPWMFEVKHHNKTQKLQRTLQACAKQNKTRKLHQLFDRIYRSDVLWSAWCQVKANGGAGGVDGQTIKDIEAQGVEAFLKQIQKDLHDGTYLPPPVKQTPAVSGNCKSQPARPMLFQRHRRLFFPSVSARNSRHCRDLS